MVGVLRQGALHRDAADAPDAAATGAPRKKLRLLFDGEAEKHALQIAAFLELIASEFRLHTLFYPTQPFAPDVIKTERSPDIAQAVFGDFPRAPVRQHPIHIQACNPMAFGGGNAEGLAIKIEVKPAPSPVATPAVKGQLIGQVAMRLRLKAVAEPIFPGNWNIEQSRAQINERHIEAAPVEGHHPFIMAGHVPKGGQQLCLIQAGNELDLPSVSRLAGAVLSEEEHLSAAGFDVDHGNTYHTRGQWPQIEELQNFRLTSGSRGLLCNSVCLAKKIFLLDFIEIFQGEGRSF